MGSNIVFWPRRHSVARVHKVGDWLGLGAPNAAVTPFGDEPARRVGGGSSDEPVQARGLRVELERANGAVVRFRGPGRPRKVRGV